MTILELLEEISKNKDNAEFVSGLKKLNLVPKEVETQEKPIDEAAVLAFLDGNMSVRDKIQNAAIKKHLSSKWKDKIENEDLGAELVSKTEIGEISKKYKDIIIEMEIKAVLGDKYDLLRPHISKDKIVIEEKDNKFTVTGVQNELDTIKGKFPNLFIEPATPPAEPKKNTGTGTGAKPKNETKTDIAALHKKAMETKRMEDIAAWEEAKAKEEHGIAE